jgi:CheY-like chemotaxis protein
MQPLLVLGIDGDQGRALQLQHAFAQEAITLVPALNATEGLQLARDLRPDALLLDAALRDAEGERLLDRIKDDPELAGLPVILLDSAYQALASEPVRAQALIDALKAVQAQPVGSVAATNGEEQ